MSTTEDANYAKQKETNTNHTSPKHRDEGRLWFLLQNILCKIYH